MSRAEHDQFDRYVTAAQQQVGAEAWERAVEQGCALPLEQAIAEALSG